MMSKSETAKIENAKTAPVLRDNELDVVSGGFHWGIVQTLAAPTPSSMEDLLISH